MSLNRDLENGVKLLWPTPVFSRKFDNTEAVNARLREIILEREQQDKGVAKSVVHGWHSTEDFFDWPFPEVGQIRDFVRTGMVELTKVTTGLQEGQFGGQATFLGWATVLRYGAYNSVHTHPGCAWSGVYYVDTGGSTMEGDDGMAHGVIEFLDPRTAVEMIPIPGEPFGQRIKFQPEAGRIYMFPAWLGHSVTPYHGEKDRIAVAFNIRFDDFKIFEAPKGDG